MEILSERSEQSSSAAVAVAGNEDLLSDILLRLPVKFLIRFQLVSKQWLSLISDPQFACNHSRRRKPNSFVPSGLFFYNSPTRSLEIESVSLLDHSRVRLRARVPSLSFLDPVTAGVPIKIIQSCNGLLLCCFTFQSSKSEVRNYCICNPTTKKYTILPQPCLTPPPESTIDFNLAFDPSESPHYKVVCVKSLNGTCQIDIYSSENGSWRPSVCRHTAPMFMNFDNGVYANGAIHWMCHPRSNYFSFHFDINSGQVKTMVRPRGSRGLTIGYFGECRGHLHLIYFHSHINRITTEKFDILEMDRDTFKWSVRYQVDMNSITSIFPEIVLKRFRGSHQYALSILYVVEGEKKKDSAIVLAIPGKVISYNFKHMTTKVLCELPSQVVDTSCFNCVTAYQYIETLSSV